MCGLQAKVAELSDELSWLHDSQRQPQFASMTSEVSSPKHSGPYQDSAQQQSLAKRTLQNQSLPVSRVIVAKAGHSRTAQSAKGSRPRLAEESLGSRLDDSLSPLQATAF